MEKKIFADLTWLLHDLGILKENEKIIGLIDCAVVIEKETEKRFTYRIIDPTTLKSFHLSSKKQRLASDRFNSLREEVEKYGEFKVPCSLLNKDLDRRAEDLLKQVFTKVFDKNGLKYRKQQHELAFAMLGALQGNLIALCEAEVGTGKTHAYILALLMFNLFRSEKESTVIATSTIALQQAVVEDYLPSISRMLKEERIINKNLQSVVRKGKSHYLCHERLNKYKSKIEMLSDKKGLLESLTELEKSNIVDLGEVQLDKYHKEKICVLGCHDHCGYSLTCRYKEFLRVSQTKYTDFQIVNHNYLIADIIARKQGARPLLADYGAIVIDEAHKLSDALKDMYGVKFDLSIIHNLTLSIENTMNIDMAICVHIREANDRFFKQLKFTLDQPPTKINYAGISEAILKLQGLLRYLTKEIELKGKSKERCVDKLCSDIELVITLLNNFNNPEKYMMWIEKTLKDGTALFSLSKELKEQLNIDLWELGIPIILTSGTMSVQGDFAYLKRNLGLDRIEDRVLEISTKSPFKHCDQALLYLTPNLAKSENDEEKFFDKLLKELETLVVATHGHTLILFTSYKLMDKTHYEFERLGLPYPIFTMSKGDLKTLEKFKSSKNGVLFASDSAGEGIDMAGDIVSNVIIVRLPFPNPSARTELEISHTGNFDNYFRDQIFPSMVIKLKQWVGRGIRNETDTCVFSILDNRAYGRFRKQVVGALPNMPITDSISDVVEFIKSKKSEDYFIE